MKAAENKTGGSSKYLRAFIAIELPTALKDELTDIQKALRADLKDAVSWARPETMHLTIKFLGSIETSRIDELSVAIKDATADTAPFELTTEGLGAFPNKARPSTLWIGIEQSSELKRLHERIESQLENVGFEREKKELLPHLTLARLRRNSGNTETRRKLRKTLEAFKTKFSQAFTVRELVLFKSELHKSGAVHTPIERFKLED